MNINFKDNNQVYRTFFKNCKYKRNLFGINNFTIFTTFFNGCYVNILI